MTRIIVVGGGPAGMMAAAAAARNGALVTLLEAMERPGKKLLLTGNGRCNLTHEDDRPEESCFGGGPDFTAAVMRQLPPREVRCFFEELGLLTFEKNGYVYPVTGQAASVREVLLTELRRLKVKVKCSEKILSIKKQGAVWQVNTATWQYICDHLILACGSKAAPKTGSDGSGYRLAEMAGHRILPVFPALTPVLCREAFLSAVAGVRCRAAVSLFERASLADRLLRRECGELQWTDYGISGIVVFQLSRFIASCASPEKKFYLEIDLLFDRRKDELLLWLERRASMLSCEKVPVLLMGVLHEKLIPVLLRTAGISKNVCCGDLTSDQLLALVHNAGHLRLVPVGTKSFDVCQVCQGGVDTAQIDRETMESRLAPGLYFAGELVDVDGLCGGYNLQWAWASGYVAGRSAAGAEAGSFL